MVIAQRDSIRLLKGALVAAVAVPLALFIYASWLGYARTQEFADRQMERTRDVINEHALKVFETVERTIAEVNEVIRDLPDNEIVAREEELHKRLARLADNSAQIKSVWIFNASGRPLVNSLGFPAPAIDFSDRDYFKAHIEKDIGTYVGSVLRPRAPYGGAAFFGISKRRLSRDGEFNGVIQISVLPEYFEGFYAKLARDPGFYSSLVRDDGLFLARYPALDREMVMPPQSPLLVAMKRNPESGKVTLVSAVDGVSRTVVYRKLEDFPAFVLAGLETSAVRNQWFGQMASHLIFGLPATGALVGILAFTLARTRRLYAEVAARQAAEEALKQSQRLEALGQLTGGVAHDFNNLLMVIGGSAERAKTRTEDAQISRSLAMIIASVQKGQALTRRLLAFSRRQALSPKVIDLGARVGKFLDELRQSSWGNIKLFFDPPPQPIRVKVDGDELEIAVLNLVLNARDAMPNGGPIKIALDAVCFENGNGPQGLNGEFAVLTMIDSGIGIPDAIRDKVFEPYFTTKKGKGTGLGLSQVYGFAQQSGGTITLDSTVGKGTTFKLFLPLSDEAVVIDEDALPAPDSPQSGGRVLLVEDNPDIAIVTADHLEQCGCTVVRAPNGQSAIDLLEKDRGIDLVFSDVVMPGVGGLELGRWLRRNRPEIPVVLATGYSEKASEALSEGFVLLNKPYSFDTLQKVLARSGMKCGTPQQAP